MQSSVSRGIVTDSMLSRVDGESFAGSVSFFFILTVLSDRSLTLACYVWKSVILPLPILFTLSRIHYY